MNDFGIEDLWPGDVRGAIQVQKILRRRVRVRRLKRIPAVIAAVDAAFIDDKLIAVASLYRYPSLEWLQDVFEMERIRFPYISGMLSFREGQAVIHALEKLSIAPDLILFDGQGIAHPRGIGIASHIGVILNKPAIGCAKSRLVGTFEEPGHGKGSRVPLYHKGKEVGAVLRTRDNVKPLFISPGHMVDIESSVEIVMNCTTHYRIPEPIRRADSVSKKLKKNM